MRQHTQEVHGPRMIGTSLKHLAIQRLRLRPIAALVMLHRLRERLLNRRIAVAKGHSKIRSHVVESGEFFSPTAKRGGIEARFDDALVTCSIDENISLRIDDHASTG